MSDAIGAGASPAAVTVVKREEKWVYLDEASARRHPLYGAKGGAAILAGLMTAFAILRGVSDILFLVALARSSGDLAEDESGFVVALVVGVITLAIDLYVGFVAYRFWTMRADFQRHFGILAVIMLLYAVAVIAADPSSALLAIAQIVVLGLWTQYIFGSVRVNVTTRKRVTTDDSLVREIIADMDPHLPKAAKY